MGQPGYVRFNRLQSQKELPTIMQITPRLRFSFENKSNEWSERRRISFTHDSKMHLLGAELKNLNPGFRSMRGSAEKPDS